MSTTNAPTTTTVEAIIEATNKATIDATTSTTIEASSSTINEAITTTIEATTTTTTAILAPTTRTTITSAPATSTRTSSARTTTIRTTPAPTTSTTTTPAPTTTTTIPTTTTTTTTTRPPSRPAPTFEIRVVLFIVFESVLTDPQSPEFQQQAVVVENACDFIYRRRFGFLFVRTIVRAFRLATRYRADTIESEVETDIDVVFNETSIEPLPTSSVVIEALAIAINDLNSGFNISVVPGSIFVRSEPKSAAIVQFCTNDTFIADLLNSSSVAFSKRSSLIKTELEPFFFEDYQPDFISLTPTSFSKGSIIHETNMTITSDATFPNDTQIIATLTRAALSGNLSFTIIFIDSTAMSAGEVSSSVNLLSACGLTIISLLVAQPW
ncbi:cell wall protein DAN4-like [Alosa alosa]|nr:cell wall protein DAN4-like [Alosa alosa]